METSTPGIYAAGDVAQAVNQIAVGFGRAALAETIFTMSCVIAISGIIEADQRER